MRARSKLLRGVVIVAFAGAAACAHEEHRVHVATSPPEIGAKSPAAPPQYLVAEPAPGRSASLVFPLGPSGVIGLVIDKRRVVIGQGEPRLAADVAPDPILGADRIPGRLGGGFVFWTESSLYRADTFDGKLVPLARVSSPIESVSFASKFLLLRSRNAERWALGPRGERIAIQPLGAVDVAALDDGRAIAFDTQGSVLTSVDGGAHWTDVTVQAKSSPARIAALGGDLWLIDNSGGAARVESDGRLTAFDKPPEDKPVELRATDPRWHGPLSPLRVAFQSGAALDDATAILVDSGNVVRVDTHTGELRSVAAANLPSDAICEAVTVPGDVLFACHSKGGSGGSFVVSHTLGSEPPSFEQSFTAGGAFYASDDGGLVMSGSCQGTAPRPATQVACVRMPSGQWEERDLSGIVVDGGVPNVDPSVSRWVPRADGHVVALVTEPVAGIYDPRDGSFVPVTDEVKDTFGPTLPRPVFGGKHYRAKVGRRFGGVVDTAWTFVGSRLRGWFKRGESIEIESDGRSTISPYAFEAVYSGPNAIGRSKDGRLYQSNDHGASWTEVAPPASGVDALDLAACTSAGCDLGPFFRVGWAARPPVAIAAVTPAPRAPDVRRTRGLELSCRPSGPASAKLLPRGDSSPEDLGLGAVRVASPSEKNDWSFIRTPLPRQIAQPVHDREDPGDETPALRALIHGFATSREGDGLVVQGPNKNALALRRSISWHAPFDPQGKIAKASIGFADILAAGRRIGLTTDEILGDDPLEGGLVVPVLAADPSAPSDLAYFSQDRGLVVMLRESRTRVAMRTSPNNPVLVSGVVLPNDEQAFLEVEATGAGRVFKLGANGTSDLFAVNENASEGYYPANPDALALGPKNELVIVRTPSGGDPPSTVDPALLIVQGQPPAALAPWSEVKLADDAACKAESGGHRVLLQTIGPWIRVTTPDLKVGDEPMIARVRWTASRPCLEGFEVKLPPVTMRAQGPMGDTLAFPSYLVAKGSVFARVVVGEGVEWRQSLECSVVSSGP